MMRLSRGVLRMPNQCLGLSLHAPRRALLSTLSTKLATPKRTTVKMVAGMVAGVSVVGLAEWLGWPDETADLDHEEEY